MKEITIGIPAYKAQEQIIDCLASIQIQTVRDNISIIIAKDNPEDDYNFVKELYPKLEITILDCEKNTGPGLARQRALDACLSPWILFMDADDVLYSPFSIEGLVKGIKENTIEVQGEFWQEMPVNSEIRALTRNDQFHPWIFARLYNVAFLRENNIRFSELRAMEDAEFNTKIRLIAEGMNVNINIIPDVIYLWRINSEHSIARIGEVNGTPQYNYDLCPVGATTAALNAIRFAQINNPYNGNITKYIVEFMVLQYFTYIECVSKRPEFARQNFFNAKRFYHECYKNIEPFISEKILTEMFTMLNSGRASELNNVIPCISFNDFMNAVVTDEYNGDEEFKEIRNELSPEIIENDLKTGVLGLEND